MPTIPKPRATRATRRPAQAGKIKDKAAFDFMARLRADFPDGPPPGKPLSQLVTDGRGAA